MPWSVRFIRASIVSVPLVLSLGCAGLKVNKPASDLTPPTISSPPIITWKVTNKANSAIQTFTGDGSFKAKWGERYAVKMTAADSRGVNEASLVSMTGWQCKSGNVAKSSGPSLESPDVTKHDVWPSGQVRKEIVKFRDLDFFFSCQSGYRFSSGSDVLTGEGKNFSGEVTTAKLTITVTP
jgi:hypothetical protein